MSQDRPVILIPGKMHPRALERMSDLFDVRQIDGAEARLITPDLATGVAGIATFNKVPASLMDALEHLEIVSNFGVGYDGVDAGHAAGRGIVVTHTPDVLNDEVADTAIGLLINTLRRLPAAEQWLRDGRWVEKGPFPLSPLSLGGRKIGFYGLGRIGQAIARRLEGFGLEIAYHTRSKRDDVSYAYHATLLGLAQAVDTLIVIVPGSAETRHTVNAEILQALGTEGVVINVGRGITIDETALIAALEQGVIAGAGLDVFEREPHVPPALMALPQVSLLPHVASASVATRNKMADLVVDNLVSWFQTGKALTPVSETPFTRSAG
ncbi:2-hydroxyacid dehydrogenase [Rhizobium sp. DKSPLA3]|uniref:2-hydroxyacid dehydrogenase n=1 Tax=Rhizobium quercicola TaxID=2901226 RepID=A0A9X1NVF1_9HYPH|nr:2-hydroxyacid dehydrogenase [Rhizobium quercicola]MCD7111218.1 2-hydroxyacid dehydrogenase [Rhizobium quercicola]